LTKNSDDVRIAQVMIPKLEKKYAETIINQKFELLKNTKIYEHKQNRTFLAIQVSCIGKGIKYYDKENYESTLFKKHFPDIKLVGIYSNGELGFDYMPNYM
jgi:small ligand-binding sensory domain FIST